MGTPGFTPIDEQGAAPKGFTPIDSAPRQASAQLPDSGDSSIPKNYGFTASNLGKNLWEGAKGAVQGTYALGKDLVNNPNWVEGQDSTLNKFVMQPAAEMERKAQAAPTLSERMGYKAAEALPFVGPWAASLGEQAGKGDIGGALASGAGAAATMKAGEVAAKGAAELPTHVNDFLRRANSLSEVAKAGTGIYQGKIQPVIQQLQGAMKNEATRTLGQAIEADKVQSGGAGTISGESAHANAHALMDKMGYTPNPQVAKLLDRLHNTGPTAILDQTAKGMGFQDAAAMQAKLAPQVYDSIARAANGGKPPSSGMSLEDAVKLRSDIGEMASRTKDAQLGKVLWQAYNDFGKDSIAGRIKELQGTTKPFDHYNNEFRSYYDLRKGITGDMMQPIEDRHDSIEKLQKFSQSDLTEVKQQMKKYGMDPKQIDQLQENARSVAAAHDSISGKYRKSVTRLALSGGGMATGIALTMYAASKGAGIYGLAPLLVASWVTSKAMGVPPEMETGRLLRKLKIDPEKWNVRPPAEGPQNFDYNVPGGNSTGPGGGGSPSSPAPTTPSSGKSTAYRDIRDIPLGESMRRTPAATAKDISDMARVDITQPQGQRPLIDPRGEAIQENMKRTTAPTMESLEAAQKARASEMEKKYPAKVYEKTRDPFASPRTEKAESIAKVRATPANKVISNGVTYEYKGGQFFRNGKVLDKGEDIADAVDALEAPPGKVIEGRGSLRSAKAESIAKARARKGH